MARLLKGEANHRYRGLLDGRFQAGADGANFYTIVAV